MEEPHYLHDLMPDFKPFTVRSIGFVKEDLVIDSMFDALHVMTVCLQFGDMWTLSEDDLRKLTDTLGDYVFRTERRIKEGVTA